MLVPVRIVEAGCDHITGKWFCVTGVLLNLLRKNIGSMCLSCYALR